MLAGIVKFFKALRTVFCGLLIIAAIIVVVSIILKLFGINFEILRNISAWVLNVFSNTITWLHSLI